jgi:hypothetical protein
MEGRARVAMAKSALKRLTDPSFPPELRLQVMAAGVQYGTTHLHVDRFENIETLRDAAFSSLLHPELWDSASRSFNQTWLDDQARSVVAETAEQAFLENAIIGIGIDIFSIANEHNMDERTTSSPLLMQIGARIRHLNLVLFIRTWDTTFYETYDYLYYGSHPVNCMNMLKARCPNLKTCILTADIVRFEFVNGPPRGPLPPPLTMFEPRVLQSRGLNPHRTLLLEMSDLFDIFADAELGKASFVRVRYSDGNEVYSFTPLVASHHYGPLVQVERSKPAGLSQTSQTSLGARLVDLAYRLERSGPLLQRAKLYPIWKRPR